MAGWLEEADGCTNGRTHGQTDVRTYVRSDGQIDGRTDGRTDIPGILQDIVPFGSAAQKAKWIFRAFVQNNAYQEKAK